ncbi:MAG: flagellar export chaperone FliS [Peptococcaceae bacterium]|jgi:flagellar protein FliS|nr:flagellar export chaperone FliS [Peptococcaceae bacterium]MDH7524775.1 flagellar export chaperone FliS [Peptococcaceae bacterium]
MINVAVPNPYQQYRQQQVSAATPEKLLLMLFDGAIRFSGQALKSLQEKRNDAAHHSLTRVQDIIMELIGSLNMEYEIAQNLYSLYYYLYRRLVEANVKKDAAIVEEVMKFLKELRGAWYETAAKAKSEGAV